LADYVERARTRPDPCNQYQGWIKDAEKERDLCIARIDYLFRFQKEFLVPIEQLATRIERTFEEHGVDVILQFSAKSAHHDIEPNNPVDLGLQWYKYDANHFGGWSHLSCQLGRELRIELKPVIGDDYPAVLRQMKANGSRVLFVGAYTGQGATEEQFVKTMATAGIRVVFARDVEGS
jgi:hypothetical protein